MANLRSQAGTSHELRENVVLGRHPDCDIVLDILGASRHHAAIRCQGNCWTLEDLGSRNGTLLNGRIIRGAETLKPGDAIQICDLQFYFDDGRQRASAELMTRSQSVLEDEVVADLACAGSGAGDDFQVVRCGPLSLAAECRELRTALEESQLVFYPAPAASRLTERLLVGDTKSLALRPDSLRHTVVLDGRAGFAAGGDFNLGRFYNYACRQLSSAYGLSVFESYHEEDVVQILRSASPTLICLVNTSAIPHEARCSLRGLTQEMHRTLVVYAGDRDTKIEKDFELTDADFFELPSAGSAPAEAKLQALLDITSGLARSLDLQEIFPKILDALFRIFPQADRGFIVIEQENGVLKPAAAKYRSDSSEAMRISRTVVGHVLNSRQAVLTADAASDDRFQMSTSIADFRIRSMMCAPLIDSLGEPLGVLQIDTLNQRARFQENDVDVLQAVASQAALAIENARLFESSLQKQRVDKELEIARQVQQKLLPQQPPQIPGYSLHQHLEPASLVASDFYDYIPLGENKTVIVIADIIGHGLAAAMIATNLLKDVRNLAPAAGEPAELLTRLNRQTTLPDDRFATMACVALDHQTHELAVAVAGHYPPLLRRAETGEISQLAVEEGGLPLGVTDDYQYEQVSLTLQPGDMLTLFTDGVIEELNAQGELYGQERLLKHLQAAASSPAEFSRQLLQDIRQFSNRKSPSDDQCLICLRREPPLT